MNFSMASRWLVWVAVGGFLAGSPLRADDGPATPEDVHHILKEALGDGPDSAPAPQQQRDLVGKALKVLQRVPHVYHGELMRAARDLNQALEDLSKSDVSKARGDILDADDLIRGIM